MTDDLGFHLGSNIQTAFLNTPATGTLLRNVDNPLWDYRAQNPTDQILGDLVGEEINFPEYQKFLAEREDSTWATADDYKNDTENFVAEIPWNKTLSKKHQKNLRSQLSAEKRRESYNVGHETKSFIAQGIGGLLDPFFYVPVGGPLSAVIAGPVALGGRAAGKIGLEALSSAALKSSTAITRRATALTGVGLKDPVKRTAASMSYYGLDASANTFFTEVLTQDLRGQMGEDVSKETAIHSMTWAFALGGLVRGLGLGFSHVKGKVQAKYLRDWEKTIPEQVERLKSQLSPREMNIYISKMTPDKIAEAATSMGDPTDNMNVTGVFEESAKSEALRAAEFKSAVDGFNAERATRKVQTVDATPEVVDEAVMRRDPEVYSDRAEILETQDNLRRLQRQTQDEIAEASALSDADPRKETFLRAREALLKSVDDGLAEADAAMVDVQSRYDEVADTMRGEIETTNKNFVETGTHHENLALFPRPLVVDDRLFPRLPKHEGAVSVKSKKDMAYEEAAGGAEEVLEDPIGVAKKADWNLDEMSLDDANEGGLLAHGEYNRLTEAEVAELGGLDADNIHLMAESKITKHLIEECGIG